MTISLQKEGYGPIMTTGEVCRVMRISRWTLGRKIEAGDYQELVWLPRKSEREPMRFWRESVENLLERLYQEAAA